MLPPRDFKSLASANFAIPANLEAPPRFGLGVRVLQTRALPLGYGALIKYLNKKMERETRFELATFALARQRSTTEPLPHEEGLEAKGISTNARALDTSNLKMKSENNNTIRTTHKNKKLCGRFETALKERAV